MDPSKRKKKLPQPVYLPCRAVIYRDTNTGKKTLAVAKDVQVEAVFLDMRSK